MYQLAISFCQVGSENNFMFFLKPSTKVMGEFKKTLCEQFSRFRYLYQQEVVVVVRAASDIVKAGIQMTMSICMALSPSEWMSRIMGCLEGNVYHRQRQRIKKWSLAFSNDPRKWNESFGQKNRCATLPCKMREQFEVFFIIAVIIILIWAIVVLVPTVNIFPDGMDICYCSDQCWWLFDSKLNLCIATWLIKAPSRRGVGEIEPEMFNPCE